MVVGTFEDARDRDLVRRVGTGDEEAFRELFRHYSAIAKGVALSVLRQPSMAEEVVQEAFLALWRNPGGYRADRGSVRAWLLSTVHHRAVDAIRREEAERRKTDQVPPDRGVEEDVGQRVVEEDYVVQASVRVRKVLEEIPPEQRRVLELMYFEGKTQSRIAQELGVPLGTVKSRTLLGMRRLRNMLSGARG